MCTLCTGADVPARGPPTTGRLAAMPVPYEETQLLPLTTDADIETRVADLVGRANSRQLWFLFLDDVDVQLPLLIPVEGLPREPSDDQSANVVDRLGEVMAEIGARSLVTVLERFGGATLTAQDAAWVRSLRRSCADRGIVLRAQLLSHRTGVRWIGAEEAAD
jgi:hypothetical protein